MMESATAAMVKIDGQIPGAHSALPERIARWSVSTRLQLVVIAELIAGAIIIAVTPRQWWAAALIAVAVLLAVTVSYQQATAAGWVRRWLRWKWYGRKAAAHERRSAIPAPFSADIAGINPVGMRWDGRYVVTMIALHGRAHPPTVLVPAGAETVDTVPLEVVSGLLTQFGGLELHSVDVVSASRRVAADGSYTAKYDEILGDRPGVGERRTWLVLRLCPQACLAAMTYRGDVGAAAAAATERIRQAVLRSGCRALTCSEEQLAEATAVLLADCDLARVQEGWAHVDINASYVTTYRIPGADLTTRMLNDIAAVRSELTVVTIRMSADGAGVLTVGATVRFHTAAPLTHAPLLALRGVAGQAFDSLLASLPLGDRSLRLTLSTRALPGADLQIPVGPTGPILGRTVTGVPFLMPLTDPMRSVRVVIDADLETVVPLILRTSASGAVVLIHSDRPELWAPLCDRDHRIAVASDSAPRRDPTVIIADGDGHQISGGQRGQALVVLSDSPTQKVDADIIITQTGPDDLLVTTPTIPGVALSIMRPRNEAQFLSHLHAGAHRDR